MLGSESDEKLRSDFIRLTDTFESVYAYYYNDPDAKQPGMGYLCKREDFFTIHVYIEQIEAHGLFESPAFAHFQIKLNINDSLELKKGSDRELITTICHELFHAMQYGCGHSINLSYSPFWEAAATYYKAKYQ